MAQHTRDEPPAGRTVNAVHAQLQFLYEHLDHLATQTRKVAESAPGLAEAITAERYLRALHALRSILDQHRDDTEPLDHDHIRAVANALGLTDERL